MTGPQPQRQPEPERPPSYRLGPPSQPRAEPERHPQTEPLRQTESQRRTERLRRRESHPVPQSQYQAESQPDPRRESHPQPEPHPGPDPEVVPVLLVMGVSGSGKTTVGAMLAGRLHCAYADADGFHPAQNVAKMRAGIPLNDEDRWPWLRAIAAWIDATIAAAEPAVVTCSALKRRYRDFLRAGRSQVRLIYLEADPELVARRLAARHGHFFPASLLESQFHDLEPPQPGEHALIVPAASPPAEIVAAIIAELGLTPQARAAGKSS